MKKHWILLTAVALLIVVLTLHTEIETLINSGSYGINYFAAGDFATGVFAAGNFSMGIFSIGNFSIGIFSMGIFSIGIFSISIFNIGIYATGIFVYALKKKYPSWISDQKKN